MSRREGSKSGPNSTAEWILLIIIGLLLLVPVYHFGRWVLGKMGDKSEQMEQSAEELMDR